MTPSNTASGLQPSILDYTPSQLLQLALAGDRRAAFLVYVLASDASNGISDADVAQLRQLFIDQGEPAPEPDPPIVAQLEATEHTEALNDLGAVGAATAKRQHLEAHPELTARLLQLAKAGARVAYSELESLVKLDLLEGADLAAFGEIPRPAVSEPATSALDAGPSTIRESAGDLPDYPVPGLLRPYVLAVAEAARSSLPTASAAVLGAVNFAIGGRVDLWSLGPSMHPASLYIVGLSASGWGKSTSFKLAFRAHEDADREVETRWQEAKKATNRQEGASFDLREVRPFSPRGLRSDVTMEALTSRMADSRPSMALASSEGGQMAGGWSLAKSQRILSFARLNRLWDGDPDGFDRVRDGQVSVYVARPRLTLCLLGQAQAIEEVLFSREASAGFTARLLVSRDSARPAPITPDWPQGETAQGHIQALRRVIAAARTVEDEGVEYDGLGAPPATFTPTPDAEALLRSFKAEADGLADAATAEGETHLPSYWSRAAEQVSRVACTLAAFRQLLAGGLKAQGTYDLEDTEDAVALVRWHSQALAVSNAAATIDLDTQAAAAVAEKLEVWLQKPELVKNGLLKLRTAINRHAGGAARHLRDDAASRRRVIDILVEHGQVAPVPSSQLFKVNQPEQSPPDKPK